MFGERYVVNILVEVVEALSALEKDAFHLSLHITSAIGQSLLQEQQVGNHEVGQLLEVS